METTTASAEQIELFNAPSIASQLPVVFDTGFKFMEARGCCSACNKEFPEQNFNGKVLRPTSHVAEIFALGYCAECNLLSEVRFRMYDDQRFMMRRNNGWYEGHMRTYSEQKNGIHHKVVRAVRWLFTF